MVEFQVILFVYLFKNKRITFLYISYSAQEEPISVLSLYSIIGIIPYGTLPFNNPVVAAVKEPGKVSKEISFGNVRKKSSR